MHLRRDLWRRFGGLALWLALAGAADLLRAQAPESNAKSRACGRVLLVGCGNPPAKEPVAITLDLGESAPLQVDTAKVTDQGPLRQLREGQRLCFTGTLSRKASATELAKFDAIMFYDIQPSDVREPFAVDVVTTCEPGVQMPKIVREQRPNYTPAALQLKLHGMVMLEALVDLDGKVADVRVIRSLDRRFGLDNEAVLAAKQWRFTPATKDGQPVRMVVSIGLTFIPN